MIENQLIFKGSMKTIMCLFLGGLLSSISAAELIDCGTHNIQKVEIQADRDDGHSHNNILLIALQGSNCNDKPYLYLSEDHRMFNAMLSIALTAKASGRRLNIHANTSSVNGSAMEISILRLAE